VLTQDDHFVAALRPFASVVQFQHEKSLTISDLVCALERRNVSSVLKTLHALLYQRKRPEQIVGALFWKWEKMSQRVSIPKFQQGLKALLDTDARLKTGRLKEDIALELLVIRLAALLQYPS